MIPINTTKEFINDPHKLIAVACVLCVLAFITVILRIYSRVHLTNGFGLDDWLLLVAFSFFALDCSVYIYQNWVAATQEGTPANILLLCKLEVYFFSIYFLSQAALKAALATSFYRITPNTLERALLVATCVLYALFSISVSGAFFFRCGFRDNATTTAFYTRSCPAFERAELALSLTHTVLNAVVDWIFATMLIFLFLRQPLMPAKTKAAVCGITVLATFGSVISVVRIPLVLHPLKALPGAFGSETAIAVTSITEVGIGLMCLSMMALRPLGGIMLKRVRQVFNRARSSRTLLASSTESSGGTSLPKEKTTSEKKWMGRLGLLPDPSTCQTVTQVTTADSHDPVDAEKGTTFQSSIPVHQQHI
ncbi:hypothetical protein AAFC00_004913 [Neodothiora populina]|uniref:Rhodopsin domain-containing protein n=1 Tax=Neodothiora populina TaxID=2781224 RepID=A0ABR3P3L3_9PEZI